MTKKLMALIAIAIIRTFSVLGVTASMDDGTDEDRVHSHFMDN